MAVAAGRAGALWRRGPTGASPRGGRGRGARRAAPRAKVTSGAKAGKAAQQSAAHRADPGKADAGFEADGSFFLELADDEAGVGAWDDGGGAGGAYDDEAFEGDARRRHALPYELRYFDTAKIYARSGDGGEGMVSFRREKFVSHGGPNGGTGGSGGAVYIEAGEGLSSLQPFRKRLHFRAEPGSRGGSGNKLGANGENTTVEVPCGTIVRRAHAREELVGDEEAGEVLAELLRPGDRALLLAGGRGGRGNTSFKSGINNAPLIAENGEEGEEAWFELELKVVADVGIVGVPNAGKSTLLSAISNARPKIANYRFTTLVPNLGVVETDFDTTVFADVPGLLEGAHAGVGLGKEFLRHCERCRVLVHVLDGTSEDPLGDYDAVNAELALFNPAMADKPQVVVFNKMDTLEAQVQWEELIEAGAFEQRLRGGERPLPVSAAARQGHAAAVKAAKAALRTLDEGGDAAAAAAGDDAGEGWADEWDTSVPFNPMADVQPAARHRVEQRPRRAAESAEVSDFTVEESARGVWRVRGAALERFVQMTNWDYYESAKRFQAVMGAAGVYSKLRKMGAKEGDTVALGEFEFDWEEDDNRDLRGNMGEFTEKRVGRGSKRWPAQIRD